MNELFNACVEILRVLAQALGMTYQEINIWLFVIIMPAIILLLLILWIFATAESTFYKRYLKNTEKESKTWQRNAKHWESRAEYYKKLAELNKRG